MSPFSADQHSTDRGGAGRGPGLLRRGPRDSQRQSGRPATAARGADGRSPDRSAAVPSAERGGETRGSPEDRLTRLANCIDAGLAAVAEARVAIQEQVADVRLVAETVD